MIIKKIIEEKEYVYEESFWTGKKELSINGVKCNKIDKKTFVEKDTKNVMIVKGSFLTNIKLERTNGDIYLKKNGGLEWTFFFLSFIVAIMSFALLSGAIGGGLGGALAVVAIYVNTIILMTNMHKAVKIIACTSVIIGACIIWWLIYTFIVVLILL